MIEFKQSVARWAPVRIFSSTTGLPVSGLAFGSMTGAVQKADGTTATFTITISDWAEATTGAWANAGTYMVLLPAAALSQTGVLSYAIASSGNVTFVGSVKVVANEEVDTYTRVGAPVGASISADIAAVDATVERLQLLKEGRWKIFTSGIDANRLVLYAADGTTPIQKWDLKNNAGAASSSEVYERVPTMSIP